MRSGSGCSERGRAAADAEDSKHCDHSRALRGLSSLASSGQYCHSTSRRSPCAGAARAGSFEKFLTDKIKVDGKTGVLGETIKVVRDKTKVTVTAEAQLSKRCVVLFEGTRARVPVRQWGSGGEEGMGRGQARGPALCSSALRYLKYLTKKYLKKHNVSSAVVVA